MNVMLYGSSELGSLMGAVRAAVRYINYIYRDARVVRVVLSLSITFSEWATPNCDVFASIGSGILKLLDRKIHTFSKSGTNSRVHLCDIKVFNCITVMCSYLLAHHIGLPTQC